MIDFFSSVFIVVLDENLIEILNERKLLYCIFYLCANLRPILHHFKFFTEKGFCAFQIVFLYTFLMARLTIHYHMTEVLHFTQNLIDRVWLFFCYGCFIFGCGCYVCFSFSILVRYIISQIKLNFKCASMKVSS